MKNRDKIIDELTRSRERCDDCLSSTTGVTPRQTVNQECRLLENRGVLTRRQGTCPLCGAKKITNRLPLKSAMTNRDRIISVLTKFGASCDDCLSSDYNIKPRQQVNMLCRELENQGALTRMKQACPICRNWKIVNRPDKNSGLG